MTVTRTQAKPAIPSHRRANSVVPHAGNEFSNTMPLGALATGKLYAVATIFSPSKVATSVTLRFRHNGARVDASRHPVSVVAHARGFRVWGTMRIPPGEARPGIYTFEVWTESGQLVGCESVRVVKE